MILRAGRGEPPDAGWTRSGLIGSVKMRPLDVGGDAKTKPTSDFEWPFVGDPVLDDVTP